MVDQGNGGHSNHNNYYDGHYVDGAADNDLYHQNNYANDHYAAQGNHYAAQGGDHYAAQGEHNTDGYYDEAGYYEAQPDNPYYHDGGYYDTDSQYANEYGQYYTDGPQDHSEVGGRSFGDFNMDYAASERSVPDSGMGYTDEFPAPNAEPYPAWSSDSAPISKVEIETIFMELAAKLGFQRDSMRNMYDHLMVMLDSRASRMTPNQALLSLHADYIGGENANYRKWYFAACFDPSSKAKLASRKSRKKSKKSKKDNDGNDFDDADMGDMMPEDNTLEAAEYQWRIRMSRMLPHDRARQIALYLLCWGEANQVRFMPEALCFIFKCANDYLNSPAGLASEEQPVEECTFLTNIITPLYQFIRDQIYEISDGVYVRRERDHKNIIGYDDCNQLFWYPEGIARIVLEDGVKLVDIPAAEQYLKLKDVKWKKCFFKTYKETRSWMHMLVNFNRIWIIHITMFWFYTSHNAPTLLVKGYEQTKNQQPTGAKQFSIVGFGGAIATLIQILATLAEWTYVPRKWPGRKHLKSRFMILIFMLILTIAPGVKVFMFATKKTDSMYKVDLALGIVQFVIAVLAYIYFSIVPLGNLFGKFWKRSSGSQANHVFTASFPGLSFNARATSLFLWATVFGIKFGVSYKFLTLSYRDVIRYLQLAKVTCSGDHMFTGATDVLCKYQNVILIVLTGVTDVIFFFLDTYLWYVLVNTAISVARAFYLGSSVMTPWRNVFTRLPKRIYSKILAAPDMEVKYQPKVLISQIWNAIIISMYREHILAINHVQKLLYYQVPSEDTGKRTLRAPTFFVSQDDNSFKAEFFPVNSEASRRISFFAQSLSMPLPDPTPVDAMPTFTVMIPHYSEKILLSLREIIREEDKYSRVTMLEYLKQLHPHEWKCFVEDTKTLADETAGNVKTEADGEGERKQIDDLPFYCIGFKSSSPEYTLRTRIWASLRSQTLYRTVSGFMNYARAIKLLYRVENPEEVHKFGGNATQLEQQLERMARRKFKLLLSMQRFKKFSNIEMENTEFMLRAYPDLQIAYLDEEAPELEGGEPRIFSTLIDGHSEIMENGQRRPKFRVQLSGNPILGDGKSDNQNHALIFYRGEYIQLIDANQDNYLEECLKIRNVLAEFQEMEVSKESPYSANFQSKTPVAIVGAREYIFSENIGILGDIAAGKEQTFGTLFARTLAHIGAKLHYGHPDFLNGVFMTTRGGVSKAQKGLHLNEDIYAGMTAITRGGRIKHSEYYQCGKGRDLGFGSVLNFTTKIGTGMGEQLLSREYYYIGTQMSLDRFLSFYYAHPGFHVNNMFIMFSIQLFFICLLNIGALTHETIPCNYNRQKPITDLLLPIGCVNTDALKDWVWRCILSIFVVFFIAFIPLVAHEIMDRGFLRACTRFLKQLFSVSIFFEIFACQIYANAVEQDISYGGARYIGTGRGFATSRIPFGVLYSRFAGNAIYLGFRLLAILLFASVTIWQAGLVYFWISVLALTMSPFFFNPHQFAWTDFFIDYREFIRWLSRGNSRSHNSSWIAFCRLSRTRIIGHKRKALGERSNTGSDVTRPPFLNLFLSEILSPLFLVVVTLIPYLFINAQTGVTAAKNGGKDPVPTDSLIRVLIIAVAPVGVNLAVLAAMFGMACCMGPVLSMCCKKFGSVLAAIAHGVAVVIMLVLFEAMLVLESFNFARSLAGLVAVIAIQRFVIKLIVTLALTREFKTDQSNLAFWTGKWYSMGWHSLSQPARELLCKVVELSMFAADFIAGHWLLFLMFPLLIIPKIDTLHSMILFWLLPSRQIRPPIYSMKQSKLRKRQVVRFAALYFFLLIVFVGMIAGPIAYSNSQKNISFLDKIPKLGGFILVQPNHQNNNNTSNDTTRATASATPS
ncbi:hypothetical protein LMH87_001400 [Akanthomyces muscarius]|uniref:1,3-beta-glucan synthase n=1 Tax=Akanthomyces muscarius TaxID=2231603 RepID=A0A9W8UG30_AKAMU|nr:hypothetical protein LMH87_001400 [Akanthomyces muscarius]KAJ4146841.1 hypothetical protein LMH87_001400 [Akanthomyces muscarius]